jgi:uncharacterized RDD family membrane protein YckC
MTTPEPPIDTVIAMETPENVVFAHPIAGPARRAFAQLIDWIIIVLSVTATFFAILMLAVGASFAGASDEIAGIGQGFFMIVLFAAQWLYFAIFEAVRGATPGKKLLGLRVVTTSGRPIGVGAAILRNLLRVADVLPGWYFLGALVMTASPKFQRIGDWAAGTLVVAKLRPLDARPVVVFPPVSVDEVSWFAHDARLTARERDAVELLLRRGPALGMARYDELARLLAGPVGARLGVALTAPIRQLAVLYEKSLAAGRSNEARGAR